MKTTRNQIFRFFDTIFALIFSSLFIILILLALCQTCGA